MQFIKEKAVKKTLVLVTAAMSSLANTSSALGACAVGGTNAQLDDPLYHLLSESSSCPRNVVEFRNSLAQQGARFTTTMVANRGFHNPARGSFSFFETVELEQPAIFARPVERDELFFGHFVAPAGNELILDQNELEPSLMIELIAWDRSKEVYNFYELVGSPSGPKWFYRGDSRDIWHDVAKLHVPRRAGEPAFGQRLRCSGCHLGGGPIMKELQSPHDSWWSKDRPLPLADRIPAGEMRALMDQLSDPLELASAVASGVERLQTGKAFGAEKFASPRAALRPLFCEEEINLESASEPVASPSAKVDIPSSFFIDAFWQAPERVAVDKTDYLSALRSLRSRFPETSNPDADHPWLTPAKANADDQAIEQLLKSGLVDREFVADVKAVDFARPLFSRGRCSLLAAVPSSWKPDWQSEFLGELRRLNSAAANQLIENLTSSAKTVDFHQARVSKFFGDCMARVNDRDWVAGLTAYLGQVRDAISNSEISSNPRGQIMEPGFRVVFPRFANPARAPLKLDDTCQVVSAE